MSFYMNESSVEDFWNECKGRFSGLELLWENASVGSGFAPQKLALDLSEYDLCVIKIVDTANGSTHTFSLADKKGGALLFIGGLWGDGLYSRSLNMNDTGITFAIGNLESMSGSFTKSNNYAVPVKIYGVKGVRLA